MPLVLFFHLPFDVLVGRAYFTYAGITTKWYLNVSPIILLAVALRATAEEHSRRAERKRT